MHGDSNMTMSGLMRLLDRNLDGGVLRHTVHVLPVHSVTVLLALHHGRKSSHLSTLRWSSNEHERMLLLLH